MIGVRSYLYYNTPGKKTQEKGAREGKNEKTGRPQTGTRFYTSAGTPAAWVQRFEAETIRR